MKCACGCGVEINPTDKYGRPHRFVHGHNPRGATKRRERHVNPRGTTKRVECACGCGKAIEPKNKQGRLRKFLRGHNQRVKCNLKNRGRNQKPEIGDDMIHKRYPIDARCPQCGKDYVAKLTVPWTGGKIKPRITCDDCEYKRYIWQRAESRKHDRYNRREARV